MGEFHCVGCWSYHQAIFVNPRMEVPVLLFKKDNLSPEQLRAVEILERTSLFTNFDTIPSLQTLATKDAKIMIRRKLRTKDLPKGDGWSWNQSRGRKSTQSIDNNIDLCFYKLTTRVRAHTGENPGYKLWIFNTTDQTTRTTMSFLWCERGQENEHGQPGTQPQPQQHRPSPQLQTQPQTHDNNSSWNSLSTWKTTDPGNQVSFSQSPSASTPILAPLKLSNPYSLNSQAFPMVSFNQSDDRSVSPSVIAASTLSNIHTVLQPSAKISNRPLEE